MTSINDWEVLREEFLTHFGDRAEISDSKLRYEKTGEFLEIRKDGTLEAGMPLHGNEIKNVEAVEFKDSEVKFAAENSTYIFRR